MKWGGEHLKEILMGLKLCLKKDFSYVHIISGEDYPTVPVDELVNFFDGKKGIYSDCHLPDRKAWSKRYKCRWPYVKWSMDYKYNKAVKFLNAAVVAFQECFPFLQRKGIGEFEKVYMGLIWAYPKDAAEYIVDYIDHNQHFWKDLQTCKIPEEFCFPTILMNSPLKERMEYNNLRFGRFDSINGWGPVYATEEDLNSIDGKGCLFARKIDPNSHLYKILKSRQKK